MSVLYTKRMHVCHNRPIERSTLVLLQSIERLQDSHTRTNERTIVIDKIPALQDKSLNDPMKGTILVSGWLFEPQKFSRTKLSKILGRLGTILGKQFHLDAPNHRLLISQGNVKKYDGVSPLDGSQDVGIGHVFREFERQSTTRSQSNWMR